MLKTSYSTAKRQNYSENFQAIVDVAYAAKKLGMSYGQYVAKYGNVDKEVMDKLLQEKLQENLQKKKHKKSGTYYVGVTVICEECGREFHAQRRTAKICSPACYSKRRLRDYYKRKDSQKGQDTK